MCKPPQLVKIFLDKTHWSRLLYIEKQVLIICAFSAYSKTILVRRLYKGWITIHRWDSWVDWTKWLLPGHEGPTLKQNNVNINCFPCISVFTSDKFILRNDNNKEQRKTTTFLELPAHVAGPWWKTHKDKTRRWFHTVLKSCALVKMTMLCC